MPYGNNYPIYHPFLLKTLRGRYIKDEEDEEEEDGCNEL